MVSKSSSQQTKTQVTLASNVNFEYDKGIIAFNNGIALLEHSNPLYLPMLKFLSNCYVSATLTKQPSAYYYEYLREFWYSAKVDAINTITFTLSSFDKPLSFNLDDFSSITGLKYSKNYVSLPPKETVRAGLATLRLVNKKNPNLSSTDLVNSSPLRIRYLSPIWRTLILPSKEVNAGSTADKSLSETTVQTVDQPKASTDKRSNSKKIPSSSKPKTCKNARQSKSKKLVTKTQHVEESVATANATKSL
ncbi:hypothetical protein Tco_0963262 [Tanacetum coccineum]